MTMITNIVFSRNRPLQLAGYLESLQRHFPMQSMNVVIMYRPDRFEDEYQAVFRDYPQCGVIAETDFRTDLLNFLQQTTTEYTLFGVDDVVFFDSVDLTLVDSVFKREPNSMFGFSLRLSPESVVRDGDKPERLILGAETVHRVDWTKACGRNARYPFELCATLYRTDLVRRILTSAFKRNFVIERLLAPNCALASAFVPRKFRRKILKRFGYFFSPNTLESWNCRWCRRHANTLPRFLYFQRQCAAALQVNTVNVTGANAGHGLNQCPIGALAERYRQGYRLDITAIEENRPTRIHGGSEHFILKRIKD